MDYNAPLLTLVAQTLANDTSANTNPYYTTLTVGSYEDVRPAGYPCDNAVQTGCKKGGLSQAAKIAIAVVVTVVALVLIGLSTYWWMLVRRNKMKRYV